MLSDVTVKAARPREKPYKLFDERGLYLIVHPNGGRWWRLKYRIVGKEKLLSLGTYPDVSLKKARADRDDARKLIAQGIDPQVEKQTVKASASNTFEAVAREWLEKRGKKWTASHLGKIQRRLELHVFPWLGSKPIAKIAAPEIATVLERIEKSGAIETAHRALQNCGSVFRYAAAKGMPGTADRNPTVNLSGTLTPVVQKHFPTITDPKKIGELLRAIDGYSGSLEVRCALQLAPLVFTRPGELRKAEWAEFDLSKKEWRIPAEKMKMRDPHVVPLSDAAIAILKELQPLTGDGRYVFAGARDRKRPMSENTVNAALRRMGFDKGVMTGHGFRSMASTLLNEQGWNRDAIERQLAHDERDKSRSAYNYAEFLPERRKMMQAWANYLDGLRVSGKVVPIHSKGKRQ